MTTWKVRKLAALFLVLFMITGLFPPAVEAQPPPQSDVQPEDTREAWERTDYGSGPDRRLDMPRLIERDIYLYGWIEYGMGANNWGTPFNGPVTLGDRSWQGQLNQLYFVSEHETDGSSGWDLGGRVDLLFGTDFFYTTALGLDAYPLQPLGIENIASWGFSKDYGFAFHNSMPTLPTMTSPFGLDISTAFWDLKKFLQ